MAHTDNRLEDHWQEVRAFIKAEWPRFTDTELDAMGGNFDQFLFYLKETYGGFPKTEAVARDKLKRFLNQLDDRQYQRKKDF